MLKIECSADGCTVRKQIMKLCSRCRSVYYVSAKDDVWKAISHRLAILWTLDFEFHGASGRFGLNPAYVFPKRGLCNMTDCFSVFAGMPGSFMDGAQDGLHFENAFAADGKLLAIYHHEVHRVSFSLYLKRFRVQEAERFRCRYECSE
jgi:hypothetical protein